LDRKLKYDFKGGELKPEEDLGGGVLPSFVRIFEDEEDGGVFGRDEEPDTVLFCHESRFTGSQRPVYEGYIQGIEFEHISVRVGSANY
jgi:hypothetical protein